MIVVKPADALDGEHRFSRIMKGLVDLPKDQLRKRVKQHGVDYKDIEKATRPQLIGFLLVASCSKVTIK